MTGHPPRGILIVAPHPDDEVIGAAGLIAWARRRGVRVRVVIVSDGAGSHPGSTAWPRRRLTAARRRESRRALARLGVDARALGCLDLPDGGLAEAGTRCRRLLSREVARQRGLGLIVAPAAADVHPDHRAVAAAIAACRHPARRIAYRVWPPRARAAGAAVRVTGAGGAARKRSLIRMYRSQLGAIRDDPGGFTMARHECDAFARPIERFGIVRR